MTDCCEEHTEQPRRSLRYNSSVHCNKKAKSSWFLARLDIEKKTWWRKPPSWKVTPLQPPTGVMVNIPPTPTLDLLRKDSAVAANGQHCTGPLDAFSVVILVEFMKFNPSKKNRTNLKKFDWLLGWSDPQLICFYISYGKVSDFFYIHFSLSKFSSQKNN